MVFAAGVYTGALRHALLRYKYRGERWWAPVFARMLATLLSSHPIWFEEFDLIVGVPSYTGPGARRDFDPISEVLKALTAILGPSWDICPDAVVKRFETPPMQARGRRERSLLAAGPLRRSLAVPQPSQVANARIVVVDDVMTEGSTLREVSLALRSAGASEVAGLVLARKPWLAT